MSHENNEQGTLLELAKYRLQVAKEDLETALDNEKAGKMIKRGVELGRQYSLKFTKKFAIRRKRLGMADFFVLLKCVDRREKLCTAFPGSGISEADEIRNLLLRKDVYGKD